MSTSTITSHVIDSPIGPLTAFASDKGLVAISWADDPTVNGKYDDATDGMNDVLASTEEQLDEYFSGDRTIFDLPLDLHGTEFQVQAWKALAEIPFGETTSYGKQAQKIGRPTAVRAIGAANGKNPVPIVLPCHRVVGANGSLTGFAGGLEIKRFLLDLESGASADGNTPAGRLF